MKTKHLSRTILAMLVLLFSFAACDEDNTPLPDETEQNDPGDNDPQDGDPGDNGGDVVTTPSSTNIRNFIFGHSLIVHATETEQTTAPYWVHQFAEEAGYYYAANGQYGFLPQHANVPPISQWGFGENGGIWDMDFNTYQDADFNTILLTAANFEQWQPADVNYYNMDISPIDATETISDWCFEQADTLTFYIYENWPDMAPYVDEGDVFDPTQEQWNNYNEYLLGDFHNWWIHYHDEMMASRPDQNIRMIPVGPIIAKLLTDTPLRDIAITDLYEDNAPHGRETIYFLAGMVTYSAMYGTQVPSSFEIPTSIHSLVHDNFTTTIEFIWNELEAFEDEAGNSRVW